LLSTAKWFSGDNKLTSHVKAQRNSNLMLETDSYTLFSKKNLLFKMRSVQKKACLIVEHFYLQENGKKR